eukprot:TRINITY_DN3323_c0_g5_i1.p1 TRINITY_DN3323_c0_g5~~TRINITY_DN3323_c0_g5_i1.p1  ORF type:complete len:318 (-),score=54.80 TRINITY_DN3323_c0_g5_i1:131-1084(-)
MLGTGKDHPVNPTRITFDKLFNIQPSISNQFKRSQREDRSDLKFSILVSSSSSSGDDLWLERSCLAGTTNDPKNGNSKEGLPVIDLTNSPDAKKVPKKETKKSSTIRSLRSYSSRELTSRNTTTSNTTASIAPVTSSAFSTTFASSSTSSTSSSPTLTTTSSPFVTTPVAVISSVSSSSTGNPKNTATSSHIIKRGSNNHSNRLTRNHLLRDKNRNESHTQTASPPTQNSNSPENKQGTHQKVSDRINKHLHNNHSISPNLTPWIKDATKETSTNKETAVKVLLASPPPINKTKLTPQLITNNITKQQIMVNKRPIL